MKTMTFGQAVLAKILPEDVYKPGDKLDKAGIKKVLGQVAERYPDRYEDVANGLMRFGLQSGEATGGASFGIEDLKTSPVAKERAAYISAEMQKIYAETRGQSPVERRKRIVELLDVEARKQPDEILAESQASGNRFALQLNGAGRGNRAALAAIRGGSIMVLNAKGDPVPVPITRSYSQGLSPLQYLAASYGARTGITQTKLSVASSGYLSKLLQQAGHRMMAVDLDDPDPRGQLRGLPADVTDTDNVGALLATDYDDIPKNTVITPKILSRLKDMGHDEILVRSPIAAAHLESGAYARDLGVREHGRLPRIGEHIGQIAGQTVGEQVTQSSLGAKHRGGTLGGKKGTPGLAGFQLSERLVNPSSSARGLGVHSEMDGKVQSIEEAPQGGLFIKIGDKEHYVDPDFTPSVKIGDEVEAGDQITDGIPNPAAITRLKGVGAGREYWVKAMRRGLQESGFPTDRRQLEVLAAGLIDRVRVNKEYGEFTPGSVVPYSRIEKLYRPRRDSEIRAIHSSTGRYLEEPVMHYTIGTRVTPSMVNRLQKFGVKQVTTHTDAPFFQPEVTRGIDLLQTDRDWMTRFLGSNLQKGLLQGVHFGAESDEEGTSFVPSRASAINFGKTKLQTGQPLRAQTP